MLAPSPTSRTAAGSRPAAPRSSVSTVGTEVVGGRRSLAALSEQRSGLSRYGSDVEAPPIEHNRMPTADELSGRGAAARDVRSAAVADIRNIERRGKTIVTLDLRGGAHLPEATGGSTYMGWLPATDPLVVWPDRYDPSLDNAAWANLLEWRGVKGYHEGPKGDCGLEPFALNYAFDRLAFAVPSTTTGTHIQFESRGLTDVEKKKRNFYAALQYIKHYPTYDRMPHVLDMSHAQFCRAVTPTIFELARNVGFLDTKVRLWDYNHTEHFLERLTSTVDGFPLTVCRSQNQFVQRLCYSGKYKTCVLKGDMAMALYGQPLDWVGLHVGVKHDVTMFREALRRRAGIYNWEYWIGDKGYYGLPEIICEYKKHKGQVSLRAEHEEFNRLLQFYRGRNEHAVSELVQSRATLNTRWRGSFALLAAIARLSAHLSGLQERMRGPRYDCYGPWPMHPSLVLG